VPVGLAGDAAGIGVEEELVGVEAVAFIRTVGAVGAIAVELAGRMPARWPCQMSPSRSGRSTRVSRPSGSKRQSVMRVAWAEKMAKFTPSSVTVAPKGQGAPAETVKGWLIRSP
jgi:hypothetical protein